MSSSSWFSRDLAVDLGTRNTRIYVERDGVVVDEPSVVALRQRGRDSASVVGMGSTAATMVGREPQDISVVHPMRGGAIADFECAEAMLLALAPRAPMRRRLVRPRILMTVPLDLSGVERRAMHEAALRTGGRGVRFVPKVMAGAIGAGLDVTGASGNLILDIGGGTTEVAVISLSGVVCSITLRVGGDAMDRALVDYMKRKFNLLIGERTAERLKIERGTVWATDDLDPLELCGRDLLTGTPKTVEIGSEEVREALLQPTESIVQCVREVLERTPPELCVDIAERGIVMVGGGSLLSNLDLQLREATGLPAVLADDPAHAVVHGAGRILEDPGAFGSVTSDPSLPRLA